MGELDGKVAVITGAGSGMARACSRVFVREGAQRHINQSGCLETLKVPLDDVRVDLFQLLLLDRSNRVVHLDAGRKYTLALNLGFCGLAKSLCRYRLDRCDRL